MARRGVIVRRLAAVEGLGSCTLIASDKTGTLTCNELTVQMLHLADGSEYVVRGEGFVPEGEVLRDEQPIQPADEAQLTALARTAVLCNEGDLHRHHDEWHWRGDAVDVALLTLAKKLGYEREQVLETCPLINQIPFEPERQYAASFHELDGEKRVYVKGAPERVLAMCDNFDATQRQAFLAQAESLAERGYRVLALAEGLAPASLGAEEAPPEPFGLVPLGLVGMIDPLRPGAREAVSAAQQAGIMVWMVTGAHPVTALAIARELGFAEDMSQVVTGTALAEKQPDELADVVKQVRVFARVAPRQKLELVEAARQAGHFVAVTGDGVNDAPLRECQHWRSDG